MFSNRELQERNRYITFYKDGWIDIFIGFGILFAGLFIKTELVWMPAIFIPVLLPAWQKARNDFLDKRIREKDFSSDQVNQKQKTIFSTMIILGLLVLAGIAIFFLFTLSSSDLRDWMRSYFLIVLGGIFGGAWIWAAFILKLNRYYLYGLLTFTILALSQFNIMDFWLAISTLGLLITICGLFILIRFVREHPILEL